MVERCCIFRIDGGESWRCGAAGSHLRMRNDGLAQDGGVVWHRGDADGRPDKFIGLISPEDGIAEDGGSGF